MSILRFSGPFITSTEIELSRALCYFTFSGKNRQPPPPAPPSVYHLPIVDDETQI